MARAVPARWLAAVRAVSTAQSDLRFNEEVGRWEFRLLGANGELQSQFYGWFHDPLTGERLASDPVTGLLPYRDLDDAGIAEVCRNLTETAVWNRHDGQQTTRRTVQARQRHNADLRAKLTARRIQHVVDRLDAVRWAPQVAVPSSYGATDVSHGT